jgi:hypothetical protein
LRQFELHLRALEHCLERNADGACIDGVVFVLGSRDEQEGDLGCTAPAVAERKRRLRTGKVS